MWKTVEVNRELVEASESCGEVVEDMWETGKGLEVVRQMQPLQPLQTPTL